MKTLALLGALGLALAVGGCNRRSDSEYLKDLQTRQLQECITGLAPKLKELSPTAATSICTCAIDRLVAHHPVKYLREIDEGKDKGKAEKVMMPIMKECFEAEIAKSKE